MNARQLLRDDALPEGTRLGGCSVAAVLAQDEFGFVYRMTDSMLLGRVVIKEYFPRALAERAGSEVCPLPGQEDAFAAGLQAFAEEARLLARLQHPGLLHVFDAFSAHQTAYQVMPLVDGCSLEQARQMRDEPPGVAWLRELLLTMLEPVEALHAAGVVHGDVRPGKVLLRQRDGRPLLLGFGTVARALHAAPDPAYAPLEQTVLGGHLPRGAWTDVYSLAAVTWFAATGTPPLASTERAAGALFVPGAAMRAALEGAGGDARDRVQLVGAVDRAMALLPPDRPQSTAELRALFTAPAPVAASAPAATSEDTVGRTVPQEPMVASRVAPPRLHGSLGAAIGSWAAVLLMCGAAGGLAWRWNDVLQGIRTLASATRTVDRPTPVVAAAEPAIAPPPVSLPNELDRLPAISSGTKSEPESAAPATVAPEPAAPERVRKPARQAKPASPARAAPTKPVAVAVEPAPPQATPRGACSGRANFSLYYCMQTQCRKPQFSAHAQCRQLRESDDVV
jgi:serine/threonine protein kinase